jgi:hypothetical protein
MSITYEERMATITTADVYAVLDMDHCEDFCEAMATGLQAWWCDPNSIQGHEQLDAIGQHFLEHGIGKDLFDYAGRKI